MDVKFSFIATVVIFSFLGFILLYLLFASFHMDRKFSFGFRVTVSICSYFGFILLCLIMAGILILNLSK